MATWSGGTDRSAGYVVTHTVWNENVGASGNIVWLIENHHGVRARRSTSQNITSGATTKVQLATEDWDTDSNFDSATNYRFTPTRGGKYDVSAIGRLNAVNGYCAVSVRKNGSDELLGAGFNGTGSDAYLVVAGQVSMNGTTDYLELFVHHNHGSDRDVNGSMLCVHWAGV